MQYRLISQLNRLRGTFSYNNFLISFQCFFYLISEENDNVDLNWYKSYTIKRVDRSGSDLASSARRGAYFPWGSA
jgi:hypothetical protein